MAARLPAELGPGRLREISATLDYYDKFASRVRRFFPNLDWSDFDDNIGDLDSREMQELLEFWADELER